MLLAPLDGAECMRLRLSYRLRRQAAADSDHPLIAHRLLVVQTLATIREEMFVPIPAFGLEIFHAMETPGPCAPAIRSCKTTEGFDPTGVDQTTTHPESAISLSWAIQSLSTIANSILGAATTNQPTIGTVDTTVTGMAIEAT